MKETDKQYYGRRGREERQRSHGADSDQTRLLHNQLADLHMERANGSANENRRNRWKKGGPGLEEEAGQG